MRWPRQEHDVSPSTFIIGDQPLRGSRAVGVTQEDRSVENICLTSVIFWHRHTTFCKSFVQGGDDLGIAMQFDAERLRDAFAGEIVFRGAKSTHEDHNIGAGDCNACHSNQVVLRITDYRLEANLDSKLVEPFSQEEGIRILAVRSKQLRANSDDLGVHVCSIAFESARLAYGNNGSP